MALRLTQPLTEMNTRNISWGYKGGRCVRLKTLPLTFADCLEIWELHPPETLWVYPRLQWDSFYQVSWIFTELRNDLVHADGRTNEQIQRS
jgi:hypothetical protein